jgi:2-dehydropantoate 2-reductase
MISEKDRITCYIATHGSEMKSYIIGAGGVGGYYCGIMARAGANVTLVCRPSTAESFRHNGLTVNDRGEQFQTKDFRILDSIEKITSPDLILLAVKTYHLDEVAAQLASVVSERTIILTLQNGVTADLQVARHVPQATILPGLTWVLSTMVTQGYVEQKAPRVFIKFGSRDNSDLSAVSVAKQILENGGVSVECSDDIARDLWGKFIWLVNFAGMAGIRKKPIGSIVNNADDFQLWIKALDETLSVARGLKISVDPKAREFTIGRLEHYKVNDIDFKPSLLKDLENGKPTEIEALSGTLLRLASQANVDTPTHRMFYETIVNS